MTHRLPFPTVPGTSLIVRGRRVRLDRVVSWPDCAELHLSPGAGESPVRLLWPFDQPRTGALARPCAVRRQRARHLASEALAAARPRDGLWCAASARIQLLPFQLEPALAMVAGRGHRVLLADAVGLGKTIQAGLILAELRARGELEHALVVTPPGLRDQWATELRDRFGLDATVADLAWLRRTAAETGPGVNPWTLPAIVIASYDFLKRPEVLHGALRLPWDALVADEAHLVAPLSERSAALQHLAEQARLVVLVTATPHAGDTAAFEALRGLGALGGDPILFFRRTRSDVGLPSTRRTHLLRTTLPAAERHLHQSLARYAARVWREAAGGPGARLAAEVLLRRACSSPASLARSLARRLALLQHGETGASQLPLPLDPDNEDRRDEEPDSALAVPGLTDATGEQRWLRALLLQASGLPRPHAKLARLARFLRRTGERAIVFTEYRDTLDELAGHLSVVAPLLTLHGALGRAERSDVVRRFTGGEARLLIATDAAGEGLNLQARCRLVINLELPWSPRRLEQRAGRVDRLGQSRPVHVVNLVAGGTNEERVLAALVRRTVAIRRAVGPVADAVGVREDAIAKAMATGNRLPPDDRPARVCAPPLATTDLRTRAGVEAERLTRARAITGRAAPRGTASRVCIRRTPWRSGPSQWVALGTVSWSDGADAEVERSVVGVRVRLDPTPRTTQEWHIAVAELTLRVARALDAGIGRQREDVEAWLRQRSASNLARERAIATAVDAGARASVDALRQRGLFDRRSDRLALVRAEHVAALRATIGRTLTRHEAATAAVRLRTEIVLLFPSSNAAGN